MRIPEVKILHFLLILALLAGGAGRLQAQDGQPERTRQSLVVEASGYAGKQIRIYPGYPDQGLSGYGEVSLGYKFRGTRHWQTYFRYPQVFCSFLYGYFGNAQVLGSSYGLMPGILLESRNNRRFPVDVKLGTGLSWCNRPYHAITNPDNIVIGSHLTNVTMVAVRYRKTLNSSLALMCGAAFVHFSNAHYQLPNVGLNTLTLSLGLQLYPYRRPLLKSPEGIAPAIDRRVKVNIRAGFGVHAFGSATKPLGGPKYPVWVVNAYASKRVGKISNWQAGVCFTYYSGFYDYITDNDLYDAGRRVRACVASVFIGHEFMVGRVGLLWQSGVNVYNPFQQKYFAMVYGNNTSTKLKTYWCNRVGAQVYLVHPDRGRRFNAWLGAYIKSNLMTADFVETALGVTF